MYILFHNLSECIYEMINNYYCFQRQQCVIDKLMTVKTEYKIIPNKSPLHHFRTW